MITLRRIRTSDETLYSFMEDLLVSSFPVEEYRELPVIREYTDHKKNFYNTVILDENDPVGFITYWDLNDFFYIEHFAIDPERRNGGYGRQVLELLRQTLNSPIVLEVELPTEEMARRRIAFYERHHFILWEDEYVQPPYRAGSKQIPMYIMVSGTLDPEKFPSVRSAIYQEVYGISNGK
ncbi:MAG: GNAT family N-acetyltransferase [Bacteroides sp.]|nr:GNAT family N-acetyltransferase [Bacteroides sp.]